MYALVLIALISVSASSSSLSKESVDVPGGVKGTVKASTGQSGGQTTFVANAKLSLRNVILSDFLVNTTTDEAGYFVFENIPVGKYRLIVEASGMPSVTQEINVTTGVTLVVEIDLTLALTESVTVKYEEGLLSTSETTTSNIVRVETMKTQPFREDEFQSALPLTPGVVKDAGNKAYVKGSRSGQSNYTVNGTDVTDPVSGESAFEMPLEAVSNIQVEEDPYSAEYGRFTGGVTNVQSKGGGEKFKVSFARLFPTFHNFFSGKVDSFRPRVTFTGPILKDRIFFLQSFEYRFRRDYSPSLIAPFNHTATERFSSFTQIDFRVNNSNQLKFNFALFPQKVRFVGLNTFNPASTTPNTKQRGYLFSVSEQAVFKNTSFLNSAISYKTADIDVYGQGSQPFTVVSDVNRGNYFADTRRATGRFQLMETYFFKPFKAFGGHSLKAGFGLDRTSVSSLFRYNSVVLRRLDNTLAQRIDFSSPPRSEFNYFEIGTFLQDRWTVNAKLTLDLGLRFDHDGINGANNLAPRLSFLWTPTKDRKTVIRGGIGIFYDQVLPVAKYFGGLAGSNAFPERRVTNFAANGTTVFDGPRTFVNQVNTDLSSPRSFRWSLHLDRGITKELTLRFGYLQRRTTNDLIVQPTIISASSGTILLNSTGRSRYVEFQMLANYVNEKYGNWNMSYTWSNTKGDLNTADTTLGEFPSIVIRPNEFSRQPFDSPHRILAYGQFELPYDIRVAPLFEYRTGFPFSAVNDRLEFVGGRNQAGRFSDYLSLDLQISKGFPIKFMKKRYRLRPGAALFNLTNHFNPRDLQNNINNPNFGRFYNSQGFGVKAKFDIEF